MPILNARYRVKTEPGGAKVRLAFQGNRVVEAKNLATGDTHTPAEFAQDRASDRDLVRGAVHTRLTGLLRGKGEHT